MTLRYNASGKGRFVFLIIFTMLFTPLCKAEQKNKPFVFTQIDLDMLEQAELLDKKFDEEGFIYKEESLSTYIDKIGQSILPKDNIPERVNWRFRVLREPLANAFALPNGSIYLSTGLLALLENESQLASVLAHEVTHVINRHAFLQNKDIRKKVFTINIIQIASTWLPLKGPIGIIIPLFATTTTRYLLISAIFGYSRELEKEADLVALNKLLESPYDPREMMRTLKLLERDFEAEAAPIFYNDHPKLQDRLDYLNRMMQGRNSITASPESLNESQRNYRRKTENVTRHNILLNFNSERYRTALALSQNLVYANPSSSDNVFLLAESYRSLGPLTVDPAGEELTPKGRKENRKTKDKLTPEEMEDRLMLTPKGQLAWENNQVNAKLQYQQSIKLDPNNANPYRGLGMLFERAKQYKEAIENYKKYLEMNPRATDGLLIRNRIEKLEKVGLQDTRKQ